MSSGATTTSVDGREKIRMSAKIRKDDTWKRLNTIPADLEFVYHCKNACYKSYTMKKTSAN